MDYLAREATIEATRQWLRARTGQDWPLARLLESGLTPWFWLDFKSGYPPLFGQRIEGYLARMMFSGDLRRLEIDGADALVNLLTSHDGRVVKIEPPLRVPLGELRFRRQDIEALAQASAANPATIPEAAPALAPAPAPPPPAEAPLPARIYSTKTQLRDEADVFIDVALAECGADADVATVWTYLQHRANSTSEPKPGTLFSCAEGELKYMSNGEVACLKRDALAKRLKRRRTP